MLRATLGEWSIELDDVLVGDVWLCSGQSNMAMIVDRSKNPEKEKADAKLPGVAFSKWIEKRLGNWSMTWEESGW